MNAVRRPSKVVNYIASGFQRSAARCIIVPMLPSLIAWFPASTGMLILAMTRMNTPPMNVGGMNRNAQQEAERVDKDMPLAARDFLARIKALRVERGAPF